MISTNLYKIKQAVAEACTLSQRSPDEVTIIGVTKTVNADITRTLIDNGVFNIAENRVDKLLEKKEALHDLDQIRWHFIGNLQRRKVKTIINEIDYFHALDSFRLAEEIEKRAEKEILCFVEVNVSGEASKQGIDANEVIDFVQRLSEFEKIKIVGLMTMAPYEATKNELHGIFNKLSKLQKTLKQMNLKHAPCTELSMGMSNDFPIAIEEGATYIRIGRSLFKEA